MDNVIAALKNTLYGLDVSDVFIWSLHRFCKVGLLFSALSMRHLTLSEVISLGTQSLTVSEPRSTLPPLPKYVTPKPLIFILY